MSNTVMEKVTVDSLSKYGIKVGAEYYNWSKSLSESEKGRVVPGGTFDMELFVADSGKKYINKVAATKDAPKASALVVVTPALVTPKVTPKATETMTKADWGAKDRSQLIGGLSHDAAMIVASWIRVVDVPTVEKAVAFHKEVLQGLLRNREEIK